MQTVRLFLPFLKDLVTDNVYQEAEAVSVARLDAAAGTSDALRRAAVVHEVSAACP